jgi:hypothetical protein
MTTSAVHMHICDLVLSATKLSSAVHVYMCHQQLSACECTWVDAHGTDQAGCSTHVTAMLLGLAALSPVKIASTLVC